MTDSELIERWLATNAPTRCPTVFLEATQAAKLTLAITPLVGETRDELYRRLYVEEGLSVTGIARLLGRRHSSEITRSLRAQGVVLRRRRGWR